MLGETYTGVHVFPCPTCSVCSSMFSRSHSQDATALLSHQPSQSFSTFLWDPRYSRTPTKPSNEKATPQPLTRFLTKKEISTKPYQYHLSTFKVLPLKHTHTLHEQIQILPRKSMPIATLSEHCVLWAGKQVTQEVEYSRKFYKCGSSSRKGAPLKEVNSLSSLNCRGWEKTLLSRQEQNQHHHPQCGCYRQPGVK